MFCLSWMNAIDMTEDHKVDEVMFLTSLTSVTYVALSRSALSNSDSKCCFSLLSYRAQQRFSMFEV